MSSLPKIIAIVGPTASGKSALAVALAKKFNGEIISADSRQVYRGMDIGTGKVPISHVRLKRTSAKLSIPAKAGIHTHMSTKSSIPETAKRLSGIPTYRGIPHYLLDVASPKRTFTVVDYQKSAREAIKKILAKNKVPILCGGTGFYIDAAVYNYALPDAKADPKLRRALEKRSAEELFADLHALDPERAEHIDRWNKRRLVRALEIIAVTKKPVPSRRASLKRNTDYDILKIGINPPTEELKGHIRKRLFARLKKGMIAEVKKLRARGVSYKRLENLGLEYRFIARHLQGKIGKEEMINKLEKAIWHYAKRQMTWFKRDKETYWTSDTEHAEAKVKEFLGQS